MENYTLKNGIKVYDLSVFATEDFDEANDILEHSEHTSFIDSEEAYNYRIENNFVGTYSVKVERQEDYNRFIEKFEKERDHFKSKYMKLRLDTDNKFDVDIISYNEYCNIRGYLVDLFDYEKNNCKCSFCSLHLPSFEEWKTGKIIDGKRTVKLGKAMRKAGYSQELLDFYSLQIKTEKDVYLTISDLPQHIAGMSYYAKRGTWNGAGGTSCQDTRNHYSEVIHLAGSLHDDQLFIGMLHDSLEDLEDMEDKLKARTIFRLIHVDDEQVLISTSYYGNNETKDILNNAIKQLQIFNIFPNSVLGRNLEEIDEPANGSYTISDTDDVHVEETIDECEYVDCPMCGGSGEYRTYSNRFGYVEVPCPNPSCYDGQMEVQIYFEIDEYIEVEDEREIKPYAEGYRHYGNSIEIDVNLSEVRRVIASNRANEEQEEIKADKNEIA